MGLPRSTTLKVPASNAFDANGLYVHNCGEQRCAVRRLLAGLAQSRGFGQGPVHAQARLDLEALERLVPLAVRMLDNVVDVSRFPLPQQDQEAKPSAASGLASPGWPTR